MVYLDHRDLRVFFFLSIIANLAVILQACSAERPADGWPFRETKVLEGSI